MPDQLSPAPAAQTPIDQQNVDFNPLSGQFDLLNSFNADRILTESRNAAGNPIVQYDPTTGTYSEADDVVITDDFGNVVTT